MNCLVFVFLLITHLSHSETWNSLVEKSNKFHQNQTAPQCNKIEEIGLDTEIKEHIVDQANSVRPIVAKKVLSLICNFIDYKRVHGSYVEQELYSKIIESDFIDRLLIKRPLMFMTGEDLFLLRDGFLGKGGFEMIGTDHEQAPLMLADYLSYDEMQIAAMLGISVPTFFINNGNRYNNAIPAIPGTYEKEGIYVGLVGARFEKPGLMEWQHMIITPEQNTSENGYGPYAPKENKKTKILALWQAFYETSFATFKEAQADLSGRYIYLGKEQYLDSEVYKKRMKMVIEPFLVDAHERGKKAERKVYCHAVGLGLGVWQKTPLQAKLMLEVYADILSSRDLSFISDINFSWFPLEYQKCGNIGNGQLFKTSYNKITIHFSKRDPADKLIEQDKDKLLVAMYAWDGNSYPGNEYWAACLSASGDPAAACCSTISELQNPFINDNVSAKKLFIIK